MTKEIKIIKIQKLAASFFQKKEENPNKKGKIRNKVNLEQLNKIAITQTTTRINNNSLKKLKN